MFQKFKTKFLIIFSYIVKLYQHKMTFVFSKKLFCRNCATFKITLVCSTQKICTIFPTEFGNYFFRVYNLNDYYYEKISEKNIFCKFQKL